MPSSLHGWVLLDKPVGISSAKAVHKVKKLLKPSKIGHAGTLDPLASGVLPLALGEATKLVSYAMDKPKGYVFEVTWGQERSTDDAEGEVTASSDERPTLEEIQAVLPQFIGDIQQVPPNYSAIKQAGERAYDRARGGEIFALPARQVRVCDLRVQGIGGGGKYMDNPPHSPPPSTLLVCDCQKGTYIRSLARDIGRALGCYGYVSMLRRTKVGKFSEANAISLEDMEKMVHKGDLGFVKPPQYVLDDILAHSISAEQAALLAHGRSLPIPDTLSGHSLVRCEYQGLLVAMCRVEAGELKPDRVFNHKQ